MPPHTTASGNSRGSPAALGLGVFGYPLQFQGLSQARWEQSQWSFGELGEKVAAEDMAKVEGFTADLGAAPQWGAFT